MRQDTIIYLVLVESDSTGLPLNAVLRGRWALCEREAARASGGNFHILTLSDFKVSLRTIGSSTLAKDSWLNISN
jgi:hypothetical protein